jgi:N-methylhydantoinase A/oxoprolinase/acetone carboxylase beta subunit
MVLRSQLKQAIPSAHILRLQGGHDYDGSEVCELDEDSLQAQLRPLLDSAEAFSVSANYSVRNSDHEQRVKNIIEQLCDKPVTISSELSDGLNGPLRALTATFNVRIISLILNLVESVSNVMQTHDIDAPLMIVKGDGSIASADSVITRPIETILSGPAASVIGANFISSLNDFIIADVGGTTTDVAIVRKGWPAINEKGAMAGGYRTMVRAIDMQTIGLGGDSEVEIDYRGRINLRSNRVVPLSLLCDRFPHLIKRLQASLGEGMGLERAIRFIFLPEGFDGSKMPRGLSQPDREFMQQVSTEPRPYDEVVVRASDRARLERLIDRGLLQVSGLTPSDAAHALGKQCQWSLEGARLACLMLARAHGLIAWDDDQIETGIEKFATEVFEAMVGKSAYLVINQLSGFNFSEHDPLVQAVTHGQGQLNDLAVMLKPSIPVVAVGGPAQVFYPQVGDRLKVHSVIPQNAEVANAVGAAIGHIKIRSVIEITRGEAGGYHLHQAGIPQFFVNSTQALEKASQLASEDARQKAEAMGGNSVNINLDVDRVDMPNMSPENSLICATVIAECLSIPEVK